MKKINILLTEIFFCTSSALGSKRRKSKLLCADDTTFSCDGRPQGYYADVNSGCQIYHMCDGIGRQFSYSCPNATLFQQRMLICDHWYMVNCSKSEPDFAANLLIGQRNKPFVEDSEKHPYHRTPRPNLSIDSNTTEFNIIYRNMRSHSLSNRNLVGIESDEENNGTSSKQPLYSPPTHWFTEYSNATTPNALEKHYYSKKQKNRNPQVVTEISNIKVLSKSNKLKIKPLQPLQSKFTNYQKPEANKNDELTAVNNKIPIQNKFAPMKNLYNLRFNTEKPIFNNKLKYQSTAAEKSKNKDGLREIQLEEIRKLFFIPDYEFPLESDYRPGYDNGPSSFQV